MKKYEFKTYNDLKIKPMGIDKIVISIDRLTRFKPPEDKYFRVFEEIICEFLISPKFKKKDIEMMPYEQITFLAQNIINFSLTTLGFVNSKNSSINVKLKEYETKIFNIDSNSQKFLSNTIDYESILEFINDDSPKNLLWLKNLTNDEPMTEVRNKKRMLFPIEKLILVEGATEEILLPQFAKILDYDFEKEGVFIMPAGGKNQVVKLYYKYRNILKIPIFILLDKDALENTYEIISNIRNIDRIHLLNCGEFEDLLPKSLIVKALEYDLKNISLLEKEKLMCGIPNAQILEEVYRTRGYHEFKKVDFARVVSKNVTSDSEISNEIVEIIEEIKKLH